MPVGDGPSHIAAIRVADSRALLARLRSSRIRAAALGDRLRVGFHYFNSDSDVEAILRVLRESLVSAAQRGQGQLGGPHEL